MKAFIFGTIAIGAVALTFGNTQPETWNASPKSNRYFEPQAPKYTPSFDVPSYGYWSVGWLSSLWYQKATVNLNTSLGFGRKFIFENQHALVLEAISSKNQGSISTVGLKTGYQYRFLDHPDLSTAYLGMNMHFGMMHLGSKFCKPIEEAFHQENPDQTLKIKPRNYRYTRPEFVLGYEFRNKNAKPKFVELGYKLAEPNARDNRFVDRFMEPSAFAVTWGFSF